MEVRTFPREGLYFRPDDADFNCDFLTVNNVASIKSTKNFCFLSPANEAEVFYIEGIPSGTFRGYEIPSEIRFKDQGPDELIVTVSYASLPKNPECCSSFFQLQAKQEGGPSPICGVSMPPYEYVATLKAYATTQNQTHRVTSWYIPGVLCSFDSFGHERVLPLLPDSVPLALASPPLLLVPQSTTSNQDPPLGLVLGLALGIPGGVLVLFLVAMMANAWCCRKNRYSPIIEEKDA